MSNGYVLDDGKMAQLYDVHDCLVLLSDLTGQGRQILQVESHTFNGVVSRLAAEIDVALKFLPVVQLETLQPA
jgi:hypothetical protein